MVFFQAVLDAHISGEKNRYMNINEEKNRYNHPTLTISCMDTLKK